MPELDEPLEVPWLPLVVDPWLPLVLEPELELGAPTAPLVFVSDELLPV